MPSVDLSTAYVVIAYPLFAGTVQSNCIELFGNAVSVIAGTPGMLPACALAAVLAVPVPT